MAEADTTKNSSGVEALISRLRDQGVQSGQAEADRILADARRQAAKMLADAKAETAAMREKATADIELQKSSALEALKIAGRDAALKLRSRVHSGFEMYVRRLVTNEMRQPGVLEGFVTVLAGKAAQEVIKDKEIQILVSKTLLDEDAQDEEWKAKGKQVILTLASDMLRDGIEIIPSDEVEGGARVRLVGENLEIDLTDEAISNLLLKSMLPRFGRILRGEEDA